MQKGRTQAYARVKAMLKNDRQLERDWKKRQAPIEFELRHASRLMILNLIEVILTDLPSSHWHEKISIDPRALAGRHKILGS